MAVTAQIRPNWGRSWRLRFISGSSALEFNSSDVNPLKLTWNYTQGMAFDPATFEAMVWGLGPDDRARAGKKGTVIELYAGYETGATPLLYRGAIFWSQPMVEGADRGLRVMSAGGGSAGSTIEIAAGTSHDAVLTAILSAWSDQVGLDVKRGRIEAPAGAVPKRRVLRGRPDELLRAWALEHGLEADVVNGTCQAVRTGTDTGERIVVVSADTGLEGGPEPIMAGFGAMVFIPRGIRFQCRLNADIRIGRKVLVQHEMIPGGRGTYIVRRVSSQGDTRGAAWTMGIEATGPV